MGKCSHLHAQWAPSNTFAVGVTEVYNICGIPGFGLFAPGFCASLDALEAQAWASVGEVCVTLPHFGIPKHRKESDEKEKEYQIVFLFFLLHG